MNTDTKSVDESWRESFARDGAGVLRGVIPPSWVDRMRTAIEGVLTHEGPLAVNLAPRTKGAFFNDLFLWRNNQEFRAFAFDSPLPRLAAEILAVDDVRLFYDQLFVMEPKGETGTPWHQDLPYWPIKGPDVISIWVPFDSVSPDNGVVSYVKGSHRWEKIIRPTSPRMQADGRKDEMSTSGKGSDFDPTDPDIEFLKWNLEPGDVLVHHGMTVHGAPANMTQDRRRRAIAVRFTGPQTRYDPRPGTWIHDTRVRAHLPLPDLKPGDALDGDLFPRVWPNGSAQALAV